MTKHTTRVDGIDVSRYQGVVDWRTVRAACANPDMAVGAFKVTQNTGYVDPYAVRNRDGVRAAGFRWRFGYHWLTPGVDPVQQARWLLKNFTPGPNEGVLVDAEQDQTGVINGSVTPEAVNLFCSTVEAVTGRPVAVYTGVYVSRGSIWRSPLVFNGKRARWVAAYANETRVRKLCEPYGFDVWQGDGGATGTMPGVTGPVDLNMVEHPIILDVACAVQTPTPPPTPVPPVPAMAGAATYGGNQMLVVVGCSDNKSDPQRWCWNGVIRHHITNDAEYAHMVTAGLVNPKWTLAAPMWLTLLELAAIPLV